MVLQAGNLSAIGVSMRAPGSLRLSREIRVPVVPFAGAAWTVDLCLRVTVSGPVQPDTGYVVDAGRLQTWVLSHAGLSRGVLAEGFGSAEWLNGLWSRLETNPVSDLSLEEIEVWVVPTWRCTIARGLSGQTMPTLTRSFHFSAAHRICNPAWTQDENLQIFGKCSNPAGHGHNYVLDVSMDMTVGTHAAVVEQAVERTVLAKLDHRNLNDDVDEMSGLNPTVEALTDLIWNTLDASLPFGTIWSIRLHETPKISAERRR